VRTNPVRESGSDTLLKRSFVQETSSHDRLHPDVTSLFLEFSRRKLLEHYWPRLRACVEPLSEEQVWWRPNAASNSIGNLILHLNGNVRQWLVASFNREEDHRDRPTEFATRAALPLHNCLNAWAQP
jgi:hypothetical protein